MVADLRPGSGGWALPSVLDGLSASASFEPEEKQPKTGCLPEASSLAALALWLDQLVKWNATHDLTAAKTHAELVDLSVCDAWVLAQMIECDARVIDVGSGAGAPGLPLALMRPDLAVALVEPLGKRAAFLRLALQACGRGDVMVIQERVETLGRDDARDWAISRATLAPDAWMREARSLVRPGGRVAVLLAGAPADVPASLGLPERVAAYTWPGTARARTIAAYRQD